MQRRWLGSKGALAIPSAMVLAAASAAALGGGGGEKGLEILFVTDPTLDRVYKCAEVLVNSSFNDSTDIVVLYDDVVGTIPLSDPIAITASIDDTLYVGDSSEQIVLALNDANENDDATESGEHWLYFDGRVGGNFHALLAPRIGALTINSGQPVVWLATGSAQPGEHERILRLEDRNLDLDANDFDEAAVYFTAAESHHDDSAITALRTGGDGRLYLLENGSTGARTRGVWRLDDTNQSGAIDQPGEESLFWVLNVAPGAQLAALDRTDEHWYVLDKANSVVYRGSDANNDGVIDSTEGGPFWSFSSPLGCEDIAVTDEGGVFVGDAGAADRLFFAEDGDLSSAVDPSEELEAYSSSVSAFSMGGPHGLAPDFHVHGVIGTPFCSGSVSSNCPCGNSGTASTGCANSTGLGAQLEGEGSTGVSNDDAAFHCHGLPAGVSAVLFQGTLQLGAGLGLPFRDGLRCVGGAVQRLGLSTADVNGEAEWGPGLASQGAWVPTQTLQFQVWYRDPAGPCSLGSNFSNGLAVTFDL